MQKSVFFLFLLTENVLLLIFFGVVPPLYQAAVRCIYWDVNNDLAINAIIHVPKSTATDVVCMAEAPPVFANFFGKFLHGVSLRTKRKSASTRLAGVDSLHCSSSRTTQISNSSMSRQLSSLMMNVGNCLTSDGIESLYLLNVVLTHSWSASVFSEKHSGPSSAMNTVRGEKIE